ncbi:MAG: hypothetical protein ACKV1O_11935 [Saprospiraceae bacterium]
MNIKASIYDFFAYTIPGGLLLLLVLHGLKTFGVADYFSTALNGGFSALLFGGLAAYLIGFVFDPIMGYAAKLYPPPQEPYLAAFEQLKKRNSELDTRHINPSDWAIWFATIRRESLEAAFEIDRFFAYSKMMQGICIAAVLAFLQMIIYLVFGKISAGYLLLVPVLAVFAWSSIRQSHKFKRWFFIMIYEAVISRNPPFTKPNAGAPEK